MLSYIAHDILDTIVLYLSVIDVIRLGLLDSNLNAYLNTFSHTYKLMCQFSTLVDVNDVRAGRWWPNMASHCLTVCPGSDSARIITSSSRFSVSVTYVYRKLTLFEIRSFISVCTIRDVCHTISPSDSMKHYLYSPQDWVDTGIMECYDAGIRIRGDLHCILSDLPLYQIPSSYTSGMQHVIYDSGVETKRRESCNVCNKPCNRSFVCQNISTWRLGDFELYYPYYTICSLDCVRTAFEA